MVAVSLKKKEDEDGFIKWYYDGYQSDYGLHFFHYSGFESWGYFVMSDVTGEVYEYRSIDTPLFCGKSGLFLVVDENPYKEECYVRVYKMLPEGRLAEVAALNRGGNLVIGKSGKCSRQKSRMQI